MSLIVETIDRALSAAGLTDRTSDVRRAIDSALAKAGLRRGTEPPPRQAPLDVPVAKPADPVVEAATPGEFTSRVHASERGTLDYKLYVPSSYAGKPLPLVVMLHGCKQNPDDFAAGTRMNELAERHGLVVAYPAQTRRANGSNCWNWFLAAEQERDGREASLIAGAVSDIASSLAIDRSKVFVAGMSAGGAAAVILGSRYPDVFAGVAVHSGLPLGAAHDVPSAFAAMRGQSPRAAVIAQPGADAASPRMLVLHGDADATVVPSNSDGIVTNALASFANRGVALQAMLPVAQTRNGRPCRRTDHVDSGGVPMVREWRVQGGGHTWFGGSRAGSYTDESGPDASAELVSFFLGAAGR
jgi:poly(hydroxyalkanoate) depolymerase family esterase